MGDLIALKGAQWFGPFVLGYVLTAAFMPDYAQHFLGHWAAIGGHAFKAHFDGPQP